MDGKAQYKWLHHVSAASGKDPLLSILKIKALDEDEVDDSVCVNGYHQCAFTKQDIVNLSEYTILNENINTLQQIQQITSSSEISSEYLLFTNWHLLKLKMDYIDSLQNQHVINNGNFSDESEKVKWRKEQAKALQIGYYQLPQQNDLKFSIIGVLHLAQRCSDKFSQYFTYIRRVFNVKPDLEIAALRQIPKLKKVGDDYYKLNESVSMNKGIKVNLDGGRVKILVSKLDSIFVDRIKFINTNSRLNDQDKLYQKFITILFLFVFESAFSFIQYYSKTILDSNYNQNQLIANLTAKQAEGIEILLTL